MPDQVTVIGGTGALGAGLALRLAVAGVPVVIGSRDHDRARHAAARVREGAGGADVRGLDNGAAAEASEVVFLCVPFRNQSETLTNLKHHLREDVLVCGDRRGDKARAAAYIELVPGLRCVDAGRLEMARTAESLTALLIGINARYKTHAGIKVTGLTDRPW